MSKLKKIVFVFVAIILLAGCEANSSKESQAKEITDEVILGIIRNNISSLDNIPKTTELYTNGSGQAKDYANDEKLLYGLEVAINSRANTELTAEQLQKIKEKNLVNITSVVSVEEAQRYVSDLFGPTTLKHANLVGCPSYVYDETEKIYFVQSGCTKEAIPTPISYVDRVTNKDNVYYATVYVGLIDGNKVYNDFNKTKIVQELNLNESFEIKSDNKEEFSKYTYTFTKNSNGAYVFTSLKKAS